MSPAGDGSVTLGRTIEPSSIAYAAFCNWLTVYPLVMAGLNTGCTQSGNQGVASCKAVFGMHFENPIHCQAVPVMRAARTVEEHVQVMGSAYKSLMDQTGVLVQVDGDDSSQPKVDDDDTSLPNFRIHWNGTGWSKE